jgi:predicted ATPase
MITELHVQGFKSWEDTGHIKMAPLTGFFGANSSGKTAILQLPLVLKQTVESADRSRVLHTGDERSYVDVGTFYDVIHRHQIPGALEFDIQWSLEQPLRIVDPESPIDPESPQGRTLFNIREMGFKAAVEGTADSVSVREFAYTFRKGEKPLRFGMQRQTNGSDAARQEYDLISEGYALQRARGRPWPLPAPVKSYSFPDQANAYYQNAGFLSQLTLAFEEMFHGVFYLGPLRSYPRPKYVWSGERPQDVGRSGDLAIPALLASRKEGKVISGGRGRGRTLQTVEERVAEWLGKLGMISSFSLHQIAENRKEYEVRVKSTPTAPEVLITDVGFGVSQILPVLVLCFYAPPGSTIILEQPEIHLHPAVQTGLADVFIDAIKSRKVQIILESHSEHLLRRLQRRVAEGAFSADQAALYFASLEDGRSRLEKLHLDLFGNITNWPSAFFGDELGELSAMAEAAMQRQMAETGKTR